jgi:hypothetical protein
MCYPITFQPLKCGEFQSALHLTNLVNSVNYSYQLKGRAEEPVAEEKRTVFCAAGDQTTEEFLVKNASDQEAVFEVKNDVNYSEGAKSIKIAAGRSASYLLTISPKNSGIYSQNLTFINKLDGSFLWYSVEVNLSFLLFVDHFADILEQLNVTRPNPEDTITLKTTVRKPEEVRIPLYNPTQEEIEFKVTKEGPDLSGPDTIALKPGDEKIYTLLFCPGKLICKIACLSLINLSASLYGIWTCPFRIFEDWRILLQA